jgi:hypothetical protein
MPNSYFYRPCIHPRLLVNTPTAAAARGPQLPARQPVTPNRAHGRRCVNRRSLQYIHPCLACRNRESHPVFGRPSLTGDERAPYRIVTESRACLPGPAPLPSAAPGHPCGRLLVSRSTPLAARRVPVRVPIPRRSPVISDAQLVLAFVFGAQTSTLDDKKAALALAKECPAEVTAIGAVMGKSRGPNGKWA